MKELVIKAIKRCAPNSKIELVLVLAWLPLAIIDLIIIPQMRSSEYVLRYFTEGNHLEIVAVGIWLIITIIMFISAVMVRIRTKQRVVIPILGICIFLIPLLVMILQQGNSLYIHSANSVRVSVESCKEGWPPICKADLDGQPYLFYSPALFEPGTRLKIVRRTGLLGGVLLDIRKEDNESCGK